MREILCDTSPLQYLHQLGCLELLPRIAENVVVPPAVVRELAEGKAAGYNVPAPDGLAWITVCRPLAAPVERLVGDLGAGETEVLMLALERPDAVAIIDDKLARRVAETLRIKFTGTLGVLLDAKRSGLIEAVAPWLDRLEELRFRLSARARAALLREAGELR